MNKWWLAPVPYALGFEGLIYVFPQTVWPLLHAGTLLVLLYWMAYYSSVGWMFVCPWRASLRRRFLRLALTVITVALPLLVDRSLPGF